MIVIIDATIDWHEMECIPRFQVLESDMLYFHPSLYNLHTLKIIVVFASAQDLNHAVQNNSV